MFSGRVRDLFHERSVERHRPTDPQLCVTRRYGKTFSDTEPSFNAGVWGMNFDLWRELKMSDEVAYWMEQVNQSPSQYL